MKKMFTGLLFVCLLPFNVLSQTEGFFPQEQYITILPPSISSELHCCVLPSDKIFVYSRSRITWLNQSGNDVKLTIGKGTRCKDISAESQVPYEIGSTGCYVIKGLPQGRMKYVRMVDSGRYDYTIEYLGTDKKLGPGSITVFGP